MKVAIMTDGNSGISVSEAKERNIFRVRMPVIIAGEDYFEENGLTPEMFFDALNSGKDVSTSMAPMGEILEMWDNILDSGYDEVVYIPMSSGLSGSCEAAMAMSREYEGKVHVVNNHRVSVTQRTSVHDAMVLAGRGISGGEICEILEKMASESSIYIAVNTLEYLKKSGRVTPAAAAIGTALNIKPLLTIQGEKLDSYAMDISMHKCQKKILTAIKNDIAKRFPNVPKDELVIGTATSCYNTEDAMKWKHMVEETFEDIEVFYDPLSLSVSSHVGPNAIGVGISRRII